MPLVYRTLFSVAAGHDIIELSTRTLSHWLAGHRADGPTVTFTRSGNYELNRNSTATVVRHDNTDEHISFLRLITESAPAAITWRTVLTAVSDPGRMSDRLVWIDMSADVGGQNPEDRRFDAAAPGVALFFLQALECRDGASALGTEPTIVHGHDDAAVAGLLAAVRDDRRRLATIVSGVPADLTVAAWQQTMAGVLHRSVGMQSSYVLDLAAQQRLGDALPREFRVPIGGLRTFLPRVDLSNSNDSLRHPRLSARTLEGARSGNGVRPWVGSALIRAVRDAIREQPLPEELRSLDSLLNEEEAELSIRPGRAASPARPGRGPVPAWGSARTPAWSGAGPAPAREIKHRDVRIVELEKERERLLAELAETMEERDLGHEELRAAMNENAWLRTCLREAGLYALAGAKAPVAPGERPPGDFEELLERMTDASAFPHLYFTIDDNQDDVRELSGNKKERLWATRAWEALRALDDYARYQLAHPGAGKNLHDYLREPPEGFHGIPVKRLAAHESDTVQTRDKYAEKRTFKVPDQVHPDGVLPMFAHIKLDAEYGICPRLYYYADLAPGRTGRIYIGYLGRHLPVHSSN
ncbi:hypothetical protein [Nocardiopsis ansamitocini]|uniref:Uncharacterized protein n=1 Tax=Nocardiopsis ansamitocini TaxID=1670832 RepID=A0A9W6P3E3_9ACTN|nr:hypothetical protein [Nocardiopsis ansamitocini]GLU46500.1 hypothetical protein Nans01_08510 [Nocardiopsis ansamitocini]